MDWHLPLLGGGLMSRNVCHLFDSRRRVLQGGQPSCCKTLQLSKYSSMHSKMLALFALMLAALLAQGALPRCQCASHFNVNNPHLHGLSADNEAISHTISLYTFHNLLILLSYHLALLRPMQPGSTGSV